MAEDFRTILACVAKGFSIDTNHHVIDGQILVDERADMECVAMAFGQRLTAGKQS